jgi:glucosamine 6-phosphate synthetase-like amidotransferase/phosphosugar isomerase protein
LAGFILLATSVFYFETLRSRVKNQTITEVEQQGTMAMEAITQSIRNSDSVVAPVAATSSSSLTVASTVPVLNSTVINETSGNIMIAEGASTAVALTTPKFAVTALNFQNLSGALTPGIVKISFTVTYINNSGRNEYDFSKTFTGAASLR